MKYRRTPQYWDDFQRLSETQKDTIEKEFSNIASALEGSMELRRRHRIKKMQGHDNIWEGHVRGDNFCFTFHYEKTDDGERVCFFRRVGTHDIYKNP